MQFRGRDEIKVNVILLVHFIIITNFRLHKKYCGHLGLEIVLPRPQAASAIIFLSVKKMRIEDVRAS
jgi:hypothetical protein